jgi:phage I-like protein
MVCRMDVSSHTTSLPAGAGAPEWLHLIPAGTFSGEDGKKYHLLDPAKVIAASMTAGKLKLPLDENHSTQRAPASGAPSPARAWIVELQSRDDGIWGRPEWNESGTALMTDKSYKGLSPVFTHTKDGTVLAILSAALTNNPNLTQLTALHTSGDHMDKIAICTALGLAGTVDDAAVLTALHTAAEAGTALQTANAKVTSLTAELEQLKLTHAPVEKLVALQTQVDTMAAEGKKAAAVAFVDAAIKAGKSITAVRDIYIAQHVADPATTEKLINAMVSINAGGGGVRRSANDATDDALSDVEMATCTAMNLDPKKFAADKKARASTEGSVA